MTGLQGGAIFCDLGATVTITDCTIQGNEADKGGGICVLNGATAFLSGTTIAGNSADHGGGIYCEDGDVSATDCLLTANDSPEGGAVDLVRSILPGHFEDCTFVGNTSNNGGAFFVHEAMLELQRCTLYGNAALQMGGGIRLWFNGNLAAENTIIAGSTDGEAIACYGGTTPMLACCDIHGNAGGDYIGCIEALAGLEGNISADPLFCDPDDGNFHLLESSPCAPFTFPNPECGLIGAWELGCNPQSVPLPPTRVCALQLRGITPNPFRSETEITYAISETLPVRATTLAIYDANGRMVHAASNLPSSPGLHRIAWDGRNVPGGVYFCQLIAGSASALERLVVVR